MILSRRKNKTVLLWSSILLVLCSLFSSCEKEYIDFGSGFVDNSTTNIIYLDTSTVELSTVYVDSISTSNTGAILTGNYTDPEFGAIASKSFVEMGIPTSYDIPNGCIFDSVELILKLNKTFYGDTLTPYNIAVHQLTEPLKFPAGQYVFYNNQSFSYNSTPLGSKQLLIRPGFHDTLSIRLPQSLGLDLFDKLKNNSLEISGNEQFMNYFKGFAIVANNNNLVMGFKDSVIMRLHYRKPDVFVINATIDFNINEENKQFNNIITNRTGTAIAALGPSNRQIFSTQTQNKSYSQYITGVLTKVRFPYARNLLQLDNFTKLLKAELVLRPVNGTYFGNYKLPAQLQLSKTDQYNLLGDYLTFYNASTGESGYQNGSLSIDDVYNIDTKYTYDVTDYLQEQLSISLNNKNGLLVLPTNPAGIFNRVILGDSRNTTNKAQLKIYYASVK